MSQAGFEWTAGGRRLRALPMTDVDVSAYLSLQADARVRRHMPLVTDALDRERCQAWLAAKQALWARDGIGPWAFLVDGAFAGWGGLQMEQGEPDLALVLKPDHWGLGPAIVRRLLRFAFEEREFDTVTALLPPSRTRLLALDRLGFCRDGELEIGGVRFMRYRVRRDDRREG